MTLSAEQTRKLIVAGGDLGRPATRALLDGAARRLYRARHPRAGARAGGDVGEFPAGIYRRAVVRPRRLFRPWRLWRRADAEIPGAEHAARAARGHAAGRHLRRHARHADRAPARRLFRDGDDRLRPGVLLHRIPVEFADRRRRRAARLLAPADRFRPVQARHPLQREQLLFLRAVLLRAGGRRHGLHPALAVRPHHDRDPRERAPLPLPRHPGGAAHLDRVHAVLLLHGIRRRALCAGQQLRRSARPALQPVRRLRHDGGDGRHAQASGVRCSAPPYSWCCRIICRASP